MGTLIETCKHCGRSVKWGDGLFANRVPDFNDVETRTANNWRFPLSDFVCSECDDETSDTFTYPKRPKIK